MVAPLSATTELASRDDALNQKILSGHHFEALEAFYAEHVEMQENLEPCCVGKEANRERLANTFASVEKVNGVQLHGSGVGDGVSFSEWTFDLQFKGGARAVTTQVAVRRWQGGLVVHERFYYSAR